VRVDSEAQERARLREMLIFDLIFIPLLLLFLVFVFREHKKLLGHTRFFWAGVFCLFGWIIFLRFFNDSLKNWSSPGMLLDAPLNIGWIYFLTWPYLITAYKSSRASFKRSRSNIHLMKESMTQARVQMEEIEKQAPPL
jgi:hypothetical protein